jgi:D-sedoheptulose 7-phosphate isomerase
VTKREISQIVQEAVDGHKEMVARFEQTGLETTIEMAELIVCTFRDGGRLYLCGNGGSAADAQHVASELVGRLRVKRRGLPAVALSTDTSILTSVGNDDGYDQIFAKQVEALVRKGDILWAFSTSGRSANVLRAVELAKDRGARIIAFTGRRTSPLEALADFCLCADAASSAPSQEIHQLAYHIICDLVERSFVE